MGHGRSSWEIEAETGLAPWGWRLLTPGEQARLLPGVTFVHVTTPGQGRGSPLIDIARPLGDGAFKAVGLKAHGSRGKGTFPLTVGTEAHVASVLEAFSLEDTLQIVARPTRDGGGVEAAVVNPAAEYREAGCRHGQAGEAGGNRLSHPHPLQVRVRRQKAASGKVYEYTSLEVCTPNFRAPLEWGRIETWADLAALCERSPVYSR